MSEDKMANSGTHDALERLLQRFLRDEMPNLTLAERAALESQFEDRFRDLVERSSGGSGYSFPNLIGFGPEGVKPFDDLPYPRLKADFDESVTPSQIHAAAELYFIYQNERMKVFQVVDVLRRLFALGRMKIQRGPGARGLYILEKWKPLRYSRRDRMIAYRRVFNYGNVPAPQGAVVNRNYHFQFVAFNSALAQYFRDLVVAEVVRGSTEISDRPFGTIATVQRLGTDLRYAIDRASYGNVLALAQEVGNYLQECLELLDAPDIKKSFDAATKWDVIEAVSIRHLGGMAELSQRAKMAEAGRRLLQFVASNDFRAGLDPDIFRSEAKPMAAQAEAWIAAYRLTQEGQRFPRRHAQSPVVAGSEPARRAGPYLRMRTLSHERHAQCFGQRGGPGRDLHRGRPPRARAGRARAGAPARSCRPGVAYAPVLGTGRWRLFLSPLSRRTRAQI
jgi:hypothetical protein